MDLVSSFGATGFMTMALGAWGLLVAIAVSLDQGTPEQPRANARACPRCSRPARRIVVSAVRGSQLPVRSRAATQPPSLPAHGM